MVLSGFFSRTPTHCCLMVSSSLRRYEGMAFLKSTLELFDFFFFFKATTLFGAVHSII